MRNHTSTVLFGASLAALLTACGGSSPKPAANTMPAPEPKAEPAKPVEAVAPPAPTEPPKPAEPPKPVEPPKPPNLPGKWVFFDLISTNVEKSKTFYVGLLGWDAVSDEDSVTIRFNGKDGAKILPAEGKEKTHWIPFVSVSDVDAAFKAGQEGKGKVLLAPMDKPGLRIAELADPSGAEFGLAHYADGDLPDPQGAPPSGWFGFNQLQAKNAKSEAAMVDFYKKVVGYTSAPHPTMVGKKKTTFDGLMMDDKIRAGVIQAVLPNLSGQWLPWVSVDDVDGLEAKVKELKGKVLMKPTDIKPTGRAMIVADPIGAPLGLMKLNSPEDMKKFREELEAAPAAKPAKQ